ncbi:nucleotidyltransferase family protein [Anaeromicropila populeti]|uniref:Mannose-1-phosphate guanylyltransferase n=1 Tax=Anaeromicropila populeti TaxID=37658 RepID=A0A1I6L6E5_9FIRM|nr:nucleotidyltransferase family protein [Anaeromicropila populeti]SFR99053.1 mannose-1-phosphate guanylyltransferase [Anaeromicropila populeti]
MKAIILAAGLGTRLYPLTKEKPKCLMEVKGKPLLQWWFELFEKYKVDEVLVNTHYLSGQVESFIKQYKGNVKISTTFEEKLLGSAGTIRENINYVENEEDFYIVNADNITNINLEKMLAYHKEKHSDFTLGIFHTNKPGECGIVEVGKGNRVTDFIEKPDCPKSNLANAGIYIVNKAALPCFRKEQNVDIGKDVLPQLINNMYAYFVKEYLLDIGTPDNYEKANREFMDK